MVDPTGGSIVRLTADMLRAISSAQASGGPAAVAEAVSRLAGQLGTSTSVIARSVAVAAGSNVRTIASLARTATVLVQGAIANGGLVLSGEVVAAPVAAAAGGGIVSSAAAWFGGLTLGAQVAIVVGAIALAAGTGAALGAFSGDDPIPSVTPPAPTVTTVGAQGPAGGSEYHAVGVYSQGKVVIVSVRSKRELDTGIPSCNFRHGGIDCKVTADVRKLDSTVYPTAVRATEALCRRLTGPLRTPALAAGYTASYAGTSVTVDDWGSLDISTCRAITG